MVFLGLQADREGNEFIRFWSSNQDTGYGEKIIPKTRAIRTLFSRLQNLAALENVTRIPAKDAYLADMLKRPSSEEEMFRLCAVASPPGSSMPNPQTQAATSDPASEVPRAQAIATGLGAAPTAVVAGAAPAAAQAVALPPAPKLPEILAGSRYAGFNTFSKVQVVRQVQEKLRQAALYPDAPDGSTGRKTDTAIRAWQDQHQLPSNGLLDDATLKSMELDSLQEQPEPPKPAAAPKAAPPATAVPKAPKAAAKSKG